jgi:hypothetical protein
MSDLARANRNVPSRFQAGNCKSSSAPWTW